MPKKGFSFKFAAYFFILLTLCNFSFADKIIYVDDDAVGSNDGSSWENAYIYLQDALADANSSETPLEIRIAQGTYKPDQGIGQTAGDRDATFNLTGGISLIGGYAGIFEPDPNERDYQKYETILSGDLAGNDADIIEYPGFKDFTLIDNSYNIIINSGSAFIDGLIISSGCGTIDTSYEPRGRPYTDNVTNGSGLLNNETGNLTITNCTFYRNASIKGGGIYNDSGILVIDNCIFIENYSENFGGGICSEDGTVVMSNCIFERNSTRSSGGASDFLYGNYKIMNCSYKGNAARYSGGGISLRKGLIEITNCVFEKNSAVDNGGGFYCYAGTFSLKNCIFRKNYTTSNDSFGGGGICNYEEYGLPMDTIQRLDNCTFIENSSHIGGGIKTISSNLVINNCIFSGNTSDRYGGAIFHISHMDDLQFFYIECSLDINNCTLYGNRAGNSGGAICHQGNGNASIKNSILWANTAPNGKQIALSGNILPNNNLRTYFSSLSVEYSNIQNGYSEIYKQFEENEIEWLDGNIDIASLFADSGYWDMNDTPQDANDDFWIDGDYHLKSQAGRFDTNTQGWIIDSNTSPCIDTGDPNSPIGLEPFPNGGYVNMGAYGGTSQASKTYFGKPLCETIVAGDINGDCRVDILDMEIMLRHWLEDNNPVSAKVINGVEFRIHTDKTFYHTGENVQMNIALTNNTSDTISVGFFQVPEFNFIVQKDGIQICILTEVFLHYYPEIHLSAGETKSFSYDWNMKDEDGNIVDPGTYYINGITYNDPLDEDGVPYNPTEVRTSITISGDIEP